LTFAFIISHKVHVASALSVLSLWFLEGWVQSVDWTSAEQRINVLSYFTDMLPGLPILEFLEVKGHMHIW